MTRRNRRLESFEVWVVALVVVVSWLFPVASSAQGSHQQLYLTVMDNDDNPVTNLRAHEIGVAENGVRGEVLYLARAGNADITILVDTSEALVPATNHLRESLTAFLDTLGTNTRISLTTFGDLPVRRLAATTNMELAYEAVNELFPSTGAQPFFQDALVEVANDIAQRRPTRPTVVVLTSDSGAASFAGNSPNSTVRGVQEIMGMLQGTGAPVHIIALRSQRVIGSADTSTGIIESAADRFGRGTFNTQGRGGGRGGGGTFAGDPNSRASVVQRDNRDWLEVLETASQQTGGRLFNIYASAGMADPLQEIAREIMAQYIMTYARPVLPRATEEIDVQIGVAREDVTVRATPLR